MARPHHESVTDSVAASSPTEALLRARRRFFGTLALFLVSLLILPFVMDSEPPASLPAPTVRLITEKQEVITLRAGSEGSSSSATDAHVAASAAPDAAPTAEGAGQTATAPDPAPNARAAAQQGETPGGGSAKTPATGDAPKPSGAHDQPSKEAHQATSERMQSNAPAATTDVASAKKNVPQWSEAKLSDTAKAQAALRGLASPQQPLTQFWYVQAGAFKEEAQAIVAVERLRRAGLAAYLMPAHAGWYRVRIAPFVSEADAEAAAGKIAAIVGGKPRVGTQRIAR